MRLTSLAFCVVALTCGLSRDALPADRKAVDRLVEQLASASHREKAQAEQELVKLGPEALDFLPPTASSPPARDALDRIRSALELAAATNAAKASTISARGSFSPEQLARVFESQTGQSVDLRSIKIPEIAADWKNVAFWDAITTIEQQTGSTAIGDPAKRALLFQPGSPSGNCGTSGPCRVDVLSQTLRPNLIDATKAVLHVRWRLRMEPRLRPLYVTVADRDCLLISGSTSFAPLTPDARREFPINRWQGSEIDSTFDVPKSVDVADLKLTVAGKIKVAARPHELVFGDLDRPTPEPRRRGTVTGVVRNVDFNSQLSALQLDLQVAYDHGGPEFESHRMWIYQNAAWLVRKEDRATLKPSAVELKENAGAGATLAYLFENIHRPPGDFEFVYEAPSLVIDVPFKLDDLRLPSSVR